MPEQLEEGVLKSFLDRLHFVAVDAKSMPAGTILPPDRGPGTGPRVLPRDVARPVRPDLARLAEELLVTPKTRVIIEKPIGHDLASARAINDAVGEVFDESQIYRIDHYLGKETVQNLMALRFANALFEPLWNADHIDHVQITVAETLGVEGRGAYYDQPARCATWCRTTSSSCSAWWRWSRRRSWTPMRSATRSSR